MLDILEEKWPEILDFFKKEYDIQDITFETFILPLNVKSYKDGLVKLVFTGNSGSSGLQYINKRYFDFLKISISIILGNDIDLQILLPGDSSLEDDEEEEDNSMSSIDSEDIILEKRILESHLDKKYTFDSFVVGNNAVAQATSLAVADSPGEAHNPLFIYGGVGLGKTHLMQSIGNFVLKADPKAKVLYTTTESFTNEVIDLLGKQKKNQDEIIEFRNKYRNVDVLLIDDIQFISGKERTQEEIFNIFNELFLKHKQIVFTSDRKPNEIEDIADRLTTRFQQGITVDIQSPDYETRMAILKKHALSQGIKVTDDRDDFENNNILEALDYIATNFVTNVRELEGSLNNVIAFSKINRVPITKEFAMDTLKVDDSEEKITCQTIINTVAEHFQITAADICSKKRSNDVAFPRQICMYLCRVYTDEKLETIAKYLKKKNHATVSYGYNEIKKAIDTDPSTKATIDILKKKINPK